MSGKKGRSGRLSRVELINRGKISVVKRGELEEKCIGWLYDNFEEFSTEVKIKICLAVASKAGTSKSIVNNFAVIQTQDEIANQVRERLLGTKED